MNDARDDCDFLMESGVPVKSIDATVTGTLATSGASLGTDEVAIQGYDPDSVASESKNLCKVIGRINLQISRAAHDHRKALQPACMTQHHIVVLSALAVLTLRGPQVSGHSQGNEVDLLRQDVHPVVSSWHGAQTAQSRLFKGCPQKDSPPRK